VTHIMISHSVNVGYVKLKLLLYSLYTNVLLFHMSSSKVHCLEFQS